MRVVAKRWGRETWLVNNEMYCGKFLELYQDKETSLHMHREKHETFYCMAGSFKITIHNADEDATEIEEMEPGAVLEIPPYTYHKIKGLDDHNVLLEISTHHEDSDSYRYGEEACACCPEEVSDSKMKPGDLKVECPVTVSDILSQKKNAGDQKKYEDLENDIVLAVADDVHDRMQELSGIISRKLDAGTLSEIKDKLVDMLYDIAPFYKELEGFREGNDHAFTDTTEGEGSALVRVVASVSPIGIAGKNDAVEVDGYPDPSALLPEGAVSEDLISKQIGGDAKRMRKLGVSPWYDPRTRPTANQMKIDLLNRRISKTQHLILGSTKMLDGVKSKEHIEKIQDEIENLQVQEHILRGRVELLEATELKDESLKKDDEESTK